MDNIIDKSGLWFLVLCTVGFLLSVPFACDSMINDCVKASKNKKTRKQCRQQLVTEFRDAFLVYGRH